MKRREFITFSPPNLVVRVDTPTEINRCNFHNGFSGAAVDDVTTHLPSTGVAKHEIACARRLRTAVGMCLGLAFLPCPVLAQHEPILGARSSGLNVNKLTHFQIWRTITLGTYSGVDAYRHALDSAGIKIGDAADEILGRPAFPYAATMKTDVALVLVSAADLGVKSESSLADIYKRARQVGLELCPAESDRSCGWNIAISRSAKPLTSRCSR
jgi:hypothetical protein